MSKDQTEAKKSVERETRREQKRKNLAWSAKAAVKEIRELRKEKRKKKRDWERKQREQGAGGNPAIGASARASNDSEEGIDGETRPTRVGSDSDEDLDADWAELKKEKKAVKSEKRIKAARKDAKRMDTEVLATFNDL